MIKKCCKCKIEKEIFEFNKNKSRKDGFNSFCKSCAHIQFKEYYHKNYDKQLKSVIKRNKKNRLLIKKFIYEFKLKNSCKICGESDPATLDFDHIKKKKNVIAKMVANSNSINTIKKEIEKCQVLCANCHRKKTAKDFNWYKDL